MWDKIIAYDLETTGYSVKKHEILEIGAVVYYPLSEYTETFSVLIGVKNVPEEITHITGITQGEVDAHGVPLLQALKDFNKFVYQDSAKPLFVGHDLIRFDNAFMNRDLITRGLPRILERDSFDTLLQTRADLLKLTGRSFKKRQADAKKRRPKEKTNLAAACDIYKVKVNGSFHRAATDADASLRIALKQIKRNKFNVLNLVS